IRPLPFPKPAQLVSIWRTEAPQSRVPQGYPEYRSYTVWAQRGASFDGIAAYTWRRYTLIGPTEPERLLAKAVTPNLFPTLQVTPILGRVFAPEDVNKTTLVVLSHGLWQRRFGATSEIIGRTITLDEKPYTVIGVMSAGFSVPSVGQPRRETDDLWTLLNESDQDLRAHPEATVGVIARLAPGVNVSSAQAEIESIDSQMDAKPVTRDPNGGVVVVGFQDDLSRSIKPGLFLSQGAATLILVIACLNVMLLLLGQGFERARELAVRRALGATRKHLICQSLTQSLMLA